MVAQKYKDLVESVSAAESKISMILKEIYFLAIYLLESMNFVKCMTVLMSKQNKVPYPQIWIYEKYAPNFLVSWTHYMYHKDLKKRDNLRKCSLLVAVTPLWHVARVSLVRHHTRPSPLL